MTAIAERPGGVANAKIVSVREGTLIMMVKRVYRVKLKYTNQPRPTTSN